MAEIVERGTVKWFNPQKGYGFVIPDRDRANELFFHDSALLGNYEPVDRDRVTYTVGFGRDGRKRAQNIRIVDYAG